MIRNFYLIIVVFMIFGMSMELHSEYVVSDTLDLPDENIWDKIYYPHTLRSAIENANYQKVATKITFAKDFMKIYLDSDLPYITAPILFEGKGLKLMPADGAPVYVGLRIIGNNIHVNNVEIQNINGAGIAWQGNDGTIENVTCIYNERGIDMRYSHRNRIGTNNHLGYVSNYIYGSTGGNGITLFMSNDNIIEYNAIGHNNSVAIPNSYDGIYLGNSLRTIIRNNIISGNDEVGIYINGNFYFNHTLTLIEDNIIGLNLLKQTAIPNQKSGIYLEATKGDTIRNNIISGNMGIGINISDEFCENITIENNIVGTDKTTKSAIPNSDGIRTDGTNQKIIGNIISGNTGNGLIVSTTGDIRNNIIGLDSTQQFAVPNNTGVSVSGGNITFGNNDWDDANVIAGNLDSGIEIVGNKNENIFIFNNIIGTNSDISKMFPNGGSGIKMTDSLEDVWIENNVISSSSLHGIEIKSAFQKPKNISVYNNYIGWSQYETDSARIGGSGIYMYKVDSVNVFQNYIYGTDYDGIYLGNDSSRYVNIYANDIGYPTNNELHKIMGSGIYIDEANDVYIGGYIDTIHYNYIQNCNWSGIVIDRGDSIVITNNVMHSLGYDGITIYGDSAKQHIQITRNIIGPADDVEEAKIQWSGIYVERGYDVEIGDILDDDANNVISHCGQYGIFITDSSREVYSHANRFRNNNYGGIALDSAINWYYENGNFNDSLDADVGSNGLQNTLNAEISEAVGDSLRLKAYFRGYPETVYGVEVYLAKQVHDSIKYSVQGDTFIERFNIVTDSDGNAEIEKTIKSTKIAEKSAELPFVTALVYGAEGVSGFSHISYQNPIFRDIMVEIDTLESGCDEYGTITIESVISNVGNTIETNIEIRDTTSGVLLLEAEISSGTTNITDNIFSGNIPAMNPGDFVRFTTKSKAQSIGEHKRYHHIYSDLPDMNLLNNVDSIQFEILPVEQNINLTTGWNLISSNIEPVDTSIPVVLDEVKENIVIVKNNDGDAYLPAFEIDDIHNWNSDEGYQVYVTNPDILVVNGFRIQPENSPISLDAGWNLISYLRNSELDCETAFESITDNGNLVIVKDNDGNTYIPAFEINSIGNLVPGQGYQIYVLNPDELIYPEN